MALTDKSYNKGVKAIIKSINCQSGTETSGSSSLNYQPVYNNGVLSGYTAYTVDSAGNQIQYYLDANGDPTLTPTVGGLIKTVDNRHAEVVDTGTLTLSGISNYSYSVISGSATVTINGVTLTGVPVGFDARQGESTPDQLLNDITITGETVGTRVIIYYEL